METVVQETQKGYLSSIAFIDGKTVAAATAFICITCLCTLLFLSIVVEETTKEWIHKILC